MNKSRILFLAANPAGSQLQLDVESRAIEQKIRSTEHRDSLELVTKWAVRPDDLLEYLNEYRPHVVHFSGHGTEEEQIILVDESHRAIPVSPLRSSSSSRHSRQHPRSPAQCVLLPGSGGGHRRGHRLRHRHEAGDRRRSVHCVRSVVLPRRRLRALSQRRL